MNANLRTIKIKCEGCGTTQDVNVTENDRLGTYKCQHCNQSLALTLARDIVRTTRIKIKSGEFQ